MGKILNFVFGVLLVLVGLDSWTGLLGVAVYGSFIVGGIGVLILLIPIKVQTEGGEYVNARGFYPFIRRWLFGIFLILSGFAGILGSLFPSLGNWPGVFSMIAYGTFFGGAIIILIGAIFILSVLKAGQRSMHFS